MTGKNKKAVVRLVTSAALLALTTAIIYVWHLDRQTDGLEKMIA